MRVVGVGLTGGQRGPLRKAPVRKRTELSQHLGLGVGEEGRKPRQGSHSRKYKSPHAALMVSLHSRNTQVTASTYHLPGVSRVCARSQSPYGQQG